MLGKLFRHEWEATSKLLLPLHIILCIITLLGKLSLIMIGKNGFLDIFLGLVFVFYILYLIIIAVVTTIYLIIRFYKNLFSDEGYLTHTLPVSHNQLIVSKLLAAFLWSLIDIIMIIASILVLVADNKTIPYMLKELPFLFHNFQATFGFSIWVYIIIFIILSLIFIIINTLMLYCSIALGHKFGKHKIIGSFVAYMVLYAVNQIVSTIILFAGGFFWKVSDFATPMDNLNIFNMYLFIFSALYIGFGICYYIITHFILKNQLNLE